MESSVGFITPAVQVPLIPVGTLVVDSTSMIATMETPISQTQATIESRVPLSAESADPREIPLFVPENIPMTMTNSMGLFTPLLQSQQFNIGELNDEGLIYTKEGFWLGADGKKYKRIFSILSGSYEFVEVSIFEIEAWLQVEADLQVQRDLEAQAHVQAQRDLKNCADIEAHATLEALVDDGVGRALDYADPYNFEDTVPEELYNAEEHRKQ